MFNEFEAVNSQYVGAGSLMPSAGLPKQNLYYERADKIEGILKHRK